MEYRPKSTFVIRRKRNNYYNIYNDNRINQSPKISSNKIRDLQEEKKLFSLIDINDKITNSKGTSIPNQYKRLSQKEINKQFGNDKLVGWSYNKLLIDRFMKRIQTSKVLINTKEKMDIKDLPNIDNKIDNNKTIVKSISIPRTPINKERKIMMSNIENQINNNSSLIENNIEYNENNSLNDNNNINNSQKKETKNNNKEILSFDENCDELKKKIKGFKELLKKYPTIKKKKIDYFGEDYYEYKHKYWKKFHIYKLEHKSLTKQELKELEYIDDSFAD